jgi:hypothetical protein
MCFVCGVPDVNVPSRIACRNADNVGAEMSLSGVVRHIAAADALRKTPAE